MSGNADLDVDLAAEITEAERAALVARVRAQPFVNGVSGVCSECNEKRARIVGGRCAFCRDGRKVR